MKLKLSAACALLVLVVACAPAKPTPMTEAQLVERGQYLVTSIGGCNDCHTPMTPQGPDLTHSLQGADLIFKPVDGIQIPWAPHAPQIAGGPGGYTDEQFAHFLQTGDRPNGSHALPPMPQFRLNEDDAHAVVAYIKTLPKAEAAEH